MWVWDLRLLVWTVVQDVVDFGFPGSDIYYSKFAKDHIFFRIVGGMMCIRNLLPILSFKQVTCMSYGLMLV